MAFVKSSHGRNKTNGAVVEELLAAPLAESGNLAEDFYACIWYGRVSASSLQKLGGGQWSSVVEELRGA